jgi:hypothetical protein
MTERWKACLGGYFEVSDRGQIRRIKSRRTSHCGRVVPYLVQPGLAGAGYRALRPWIEGVAGRAVYVHRLVAEAFIGPCPEGHEVNHLNGNKQDNRVENLEYTTRQGNVIHARDQRRVGRQKLTPGAVDAIRRHSAKGVAVGALAALYGVSKSTIHRVVSHHSFASLVLQRRP